MNLVRALAAEGLKPVALVPPGQGEAELRQAGVPVHTIPMSADDTSPLSGFILVLRYIQALRRIRPAAFLGFTPKPNIFGSMAASTLKIPVFNNVTGLGTAFIHGGILGTLVPNLYRVALRRSHRVFFHNEEDENLFLEKRLAPPGKTAVIPGSGVDLQHFIASEQGKAIRLFEAQNGDLVPILGRAQEIRQDLRLAERVGQAIVRDVEHSHRRQLYGRRRLRQARGSAG